MTTACCTWGRSPAVYTVLESITAVAVPAGSLSIPLMSDLDNPVVLAQPSWNTVVMITSRGPTFVTVGFTTPPPAGARLDVLARSEGSSAASILSIPTAADHVVYFVPAALAPAIVLVTPNWATSVGIGCDGFSAVFNFSVPAPMGATLDVLVFSNATGRVIQPAAASFLVPTGVSGQRVFAAASWPIVVWNVGNAGLVALQSVPPLGGTLEVITRASAAGGLLKCGNCPSPPSGLSL